MNNRKDFLCLSIQARDVIVEYLSQRPYCEVADGVMALKNLQSLESYCEGCDARRRNSGPTVSDNDGSKPGPVEEWVSGRDISGLPRTYF